MERGNWGRRGGRKERANEGKGAEGSGAREEPAALRMVEQKDGEDLAEPAWQAFLNKHTGGGLEGEGAERKERQKATQGCDEFQRKACRARACRTACPGPRSPHPASCAFSRQSLCQSRSRTPTPPVSTLLLLPLLLTIHLYIHTYTHGRRRME